MRTEQLYTSCQQPTTVTQLKWPWAHVKDRPILHSQILDHVSRQPIQWLSQVSNTITVARIIATMTSCNVRLAFFKRPIYLHWYVHIYHLVTKLVYISNSDQYSYSIPLCMVLPACLPADNVCKFSYTYSSSTITVICLPSLLSFMMPISPCCMVKLVIYNINPLFT